MTRVLELLAEIEVHSVKPVNAEVFPSPLERVDINLMLLRILHARLIHCQPLFDKNAPECPFGFTSRVGWKIIAIYSGPKEPKDFVNEKNA
ncbi:hypothetical protein TNCV_796091 [Trichonephila clavipes]|nr:hypothetical protein TNCV_796091 [Trichonephila clavipes]